jgi:hypothetical protein
MNLVMWSCHMKLMSIYRPNKVNYLTSHVLIHMKLMSIYMPNSCDLHEVDPLSLESFTIFLRLGFSQNLKYLHKVEVQIIVVFFPWFILHWNDSCVVCRWSSSFSEISWNGQDVLMDVTQDKISNTFPRKKKKEK